MNGKKNRKCPLCFEKDYSLFSPFSRRIFKDLQISQDITESKDLVLAFDVNPITEDHLIIFPKKHYLSFSEINIDICSQFNEIVKQIEEKLKTKDLFMFEHGAGLVEEKETSCGNSIHHAHMHIFPAKDDDILSHCLQAVDSFNGFNKSFLKVDYDWISNFRKITQKSPYLMLRREEESYFFPESEANEFPSQFLRKTIAEYIYGENAFWDWKKANEKDVEKIKERVLKTKNKMRGY